MKIRYAQRTLLEFINQWSLQHHNHGYDKSCFSDLDMDMNFPVKEIKEVKNREDVKFVTFLLDDEGKHANLYMRDTDLNALPIFDTGESITLH